MKVSALNVRSHRYHSCALNHLRRALRIDMSEMAQCEDCQKWRYVTAAMAVAVQTASFECDDVGCLCSKPDDYGVTRQSRRE